MKARRRLFPDTPPIMETPRSRYPPSFIRGRKLNFDEKSDSYKTMFVAVILFIIVGLAAVLVYNLN